MRLGCRCTHTHDRMMIAYSLCSDGETWTHPDCGQPSHENIERQDMINYFRGGPHHNELIETEVLVKSAEYAWISSYRWLPEKIVGSVSGKEARVWVWSPTRT